LNLAVSAAEVITESMDKEMGSVSFVCRLSQEQIEITIATNSQTVLNFILLRFRIKAIILFND
jgi:hypothetical protein